MVGKVKLKESGSFLGGAKSRLGVETLELLSLYKYHLNEHYNKKKLDCQALNALCPVFSRGSTSARGALRGFLSGADLNRGPIIGKGNGNLGHVIARIIKVAILNVCNKRVVKGPSLDCIPCGVNLLDDNTLKGGDCADLGNCRSIVNVGGRSIARFKNDSGQVDRCVRANRVHKSNVNVVPLCSIAGFVAFLAYQVAPSGIEPMRTKNLYCLFGSRSIADVQKPAELAIVYVSLSCSIIISC